MVKEKRILSYFLGWLIVGFCIIFVGVNNVFAEEVAYSNATFRVKECGSNEWSNWTSTTQKLSVYSINNLGFRLYFSNTQLTANTYYNITVTYNFYTETPSINVMNAYGKSTFYYNTTDSESGNIQGNNNNYSVRFEKDTENTNLIKAVYNVLVPVNAKFIAFNINWEKPNKDTCRTLSDGFTISNIKVESLNDTQAIVDGNNANTENIINNNNQNTQDIIDANKETQEVIKDQFETCRPSKNLWPLSTSYTTATGNDYVLRDTPITIKPGTYTISFKNSSNTKVLFNFKDSSGTSKEVYFENNYVQTVTFSNEQVLTAIYIYDRPSTISEIQFQSGNSATKFEEPGEEICSNRIDETNDKLDNITGALTDSSPTDMSILGDTAGWLPPGPVDSIINLPLTFFLNLSQSLSSECRPVSLPLPYVNKNISLPCMYSIYEKIGITGIGGFLTWVGLICSAVMLFNYLLDLYHWVDKTLTMRENTMPGYYEDKWGGGA